MARQPPSSILIIGSGVFGLSTAWSLSKRPEFAKTTITVVDDVRGGKFPPADCASVDSSRIIRPDYSDPHYAELAAIAQQEWRKQGDDDLGGQGRYSESGLLLTADKPKVVKKGKLSTMDYTVNSWKNVAEIARRSGYPAHKIRTLESPEALQDMVKSSGRPGDWGYINELSGWADSGRGMEWLYKQVKAIGRVDFIDANVCELLNEGSRVTGARLDNGRIVKSELVFVAAGAWTGKLIDLRGRTEATGQALAYVDITQAELDVLKKQPVVLNLSSGLFIIPPQDKVLKVARHSYGYLNPVTVTSALPTSHSKPRESFVTSLPRTTRNGEPGCCIPLEADLDLRKALKDLIPIQGPETRPWKGTRLCWYSDTRDGDWLVDYHPGWQGLFVATGDSGHGYKFLPVLGDKIADCILGRGGELANKWRWKEVEDDGSGKIVNGRYQGLITEDGSRGSFYGLILEEELARSASPKL